MAPQPQTISVQANVRSLIKRFELLSSYNNSALSLPVLASGAAFVRPRETVVKRALSSANMPYNLTSSLLTVPAPAPERTVSNIPLDLSQTASNLHSPTPDFILTRLSNTETNGTKVVCASSQQCGAPRLALRRISQSVKRKASFFIEHSQKVEDLPIRKSPPPRRLFGDDIGKKVSKKVMDKFDEPGLTKEREKRLGRLPGNCNTDQEYSDVTLCHRIGGRGSSGDGTGDNRTALGGLARATTSQEVSSDSNQRNSLATDKSSNRSSTSYPLQAPVTPPVIKKVPNNFAKNFLHPPHCGRDGTQDFGPVVRGGPQRTPEVRSIPPALRRGKSSAAELLSASKDTTIASCRSLTRSKHGSNSNHAGARCTRWTGWAGNPVRSTEVDQREFEESKRKRIPPPKISVRSLIARFKGAEKVPKHVKSAQTQPQNRVEVRLEEPSSQANKEKAQRSLPIQTFFANPGCEKLSTFAFVAPVCSTIPVDDIPNEATESNSRWGKPSHARKAVRSFALHIAARNDDHMQTDGSEEEGEYIRGGFNIPRMRSGLRVPTTVYEPKSGSTSSINTESPPSLTSTDAILTRHSRPKMTIYGSKAREDSGFSSVSRPDVYLGARLSNVSFDNYSGVTSKSVKETPENRTKEQPIVYKPYAPPPLLPKELVNEYRAYHPPEPVMAYHPELLPPTPPFHRTSPRIACRGTPAPAAFFRKGRLLARQEGSSRGSSRSNISTDEGMKSNTKTNTMPGSFLSESSRSERTTDARESEDSSLYPKYDGDIGGRHRAGGSGYYPVEADVDEAGEQAQKGDLQRNFMDDDSLSELEGGEYTEVSYEEHELSANSPQDSPAPVSSRGIALRGGGHVQSSSSSLLIQHQLPLYSNKHHPTQPHMAGSTNARIIHQAGACFAPAEPAGPGRVNLWNGDRNYPPPSYSDANQSPSTLTTTAAATATTTYIAPHSSNLHTTSVVRTDNGIRPATPHRNARGKGRPVPNHIQNYNQAANPRTITQINSNHVRETTDTDGAKLVRILLFHGNLARGGQNGEFGTEAEIKGMRERLRLLEGTRLPVAGTPPAEVVIPRPKNLVQRATIERLVQAWG